MTMILHNNQKHESLYPSWAVSQSNHCQKVMNKNILLGQQNP